MKNKIIILILLGVLFIPGVASATTIADYRSKISSLEKQKQEAKDNAASVQAKIDAAKARINEITNQIVEVKKSQEETKKEIERLEKEIEAKEEEIKDLVAFYQISSTDNFYLKFIFGAEDFEDFIYRFSVAEQLTEANDKLVDEMNALIEQNQKKIKELEDQEKRLNNLNSELQKEIEKLGTEKKKYSENALSIDDEIDAIKKQITYYKNKGCGENEDVAICSRPKSYGSSSSGASAMTPSAKGFIIPTPSGYITSMYGGRIHPIFGVASYHDGVDIAASTGTAVWASQKGEVVYAGWYYGFGNAVLVYHGAAGYNYTTLYGHLNSISVSTGQGVSRGQVIGTVGSTGNSTGPHLHFQAMYGSGYGTSFDPYNLVYMPISW